MSKALEALNKIQSELKAPKNLYNTFGKYSYRNFEGICEAVKPLLKETKTTLTLEDHISQVGDRYYVTAYAVLTSLEDESSVTASASAREALDKKGMDESQITGTASSYARKYCLNGLFLLDDTKDADTDEYHKQTHQEEIKEAKQVKEAKGDPSGSISKAQVKKLTDKCAEDGVTEQQICSYMNCKSFDSMTKTQAVALAKKWSEIVSSIKMNEIVKDTEGIPFK